MRKAENPYVGTVREVERERAMRPPVEISEFFSSAGCSEKKLVGDFRETP